MNMDSYRCCLSTSRAGRDIVELSALLKLVAEESRLKLLCILSSGECCVCELVKHVDLSQSLISHHLKDLKDAGIVADDKRGLRVYYSLTDKGRHITDLLFKVYAKEVEWV